MAKLKVFRTAIGFHDAYVAATSRKAALEAWGTDKDLFARGAAEVVTDPELSAEPLASRGTVVKRTRGGLREHLSAAGPMPAARSKAAPKAKPAPTKAPAKSRMSAKTKTSPEPKVRARPMPKPKPRPSRDELGKNEEALAAVKADAKAELAEMDRRIANLRKDRERLQARQAKAIAASEKRLAAAKSRYDRALDRWRKA